MEDSKKIKVKNRVGGTVVYVIPDMDLTREFQGQEEKILTYEEMRKLSYTPGGRKLIEDYLIIKDKEAIEELNLHVEPEYYYEKEQVIELLKNGSLDEFLDCLDFAPDGVIDLIKQYAVELPLNDVAKRKAILDKVGFDVTKAIEMKEYIEEDNKEDAPVTKRRAAAPVGKGSDSNTTYSGARRVVTSEK